MSDGLQIAIRSVLLFITNTELTMSIGMHHKTPQVPCFLASIDSAYVWHIFVPDLRTGRILCEPSVA